MHSFPSFADIALTSVPSALPATLGPFMVSSGDAMPNDDVENRGGAGRPTPAVHNEGCNSLCWKAGDSLSG
jgi:hypothetical protein